MKIVFVPADAADAPILVLPVAKDGLAAIRWPDTLPMAQTVARTAAAPAASRARRGRSSICSWVRRTAACAT